MAGGGFVAAEGGARDYGERITFSIVVTCLMAASCGFDTGVSGAYSTRLLERHTIDKDEDDRPDVPEQTPRNAVFLPFLTPTNTYSMGRFCFILQ
ncbi:hypothetical protein PR202_ga20124 [Eleusine coracana subsp. coracana]|uniref:Uncharacterized protein n=1 Tax=Eleusine coracana subsp. coracana TaxID=191504 RepID=A0AAV5CVY3_ELECO|nr:hypothetical protein PR202_ga20124 [Eleusine coracana subsp. coracana]